MLANWELEKSRILQDELGVTEEEVAQLAASASQAGLGASSLRQSSLGQSTRRFPMSSSVYGSKVSTADREGGLAMHTKMLRYSRVVSVSLSCLLSD
jgi:nuclear pore complex protein Nup93